MAAALLVFDFVGNEGTEAWASVGHASHLSLDPAETAVCLAQVGWEEGQVMWVLILPRAPVLPRG